MLAVLQPDARDPAKVGIEQSLAADGAMASFSSNFLRLGLNADRAPQLKALVGRNN